MVLDRAAGNVRHHRRRSSALQDRYVGAGTAGLDDRGRDGGQGVLKRQVLLEVLLPWPQGCVPPPPSVSLVADSSVCPVAPRRASKVYPSGMWWCSVRVAWIACAHNSGVARVLPSLHKVRCWRAPAPSKKAANATPQQRCLSFQNSRPLCNAIATS